MATQTLATADAILKDRAVESLSSFIGVDGTNTTLNSGRFLITLKAREARSASADQTATREQERGRAPA